MGDRRKRLWIVRHAKSSWDDPTLADHDRPLAPRGTKAVRRLRHHLESLGATPDLVLCSSSRRTVETLAGIRPVLGADASIEIDDALYGVTARELVPRLQRVADDCEGVMLVGHNPGSLDLVELLAGRGAWAQWHLDKFPTAACAVLSAPGRWADLRPGGARLDSVWTPRRASSAVR